MSDHPISLRDIVFTKVLVQSVPGYIATETEQNPVVINNNLNVNSPKNADEPWQATMTTQINIDGKKDSPYIIDIECHGVFDVLPGTLDNEAANRGVTITAHSVLYGAIRETIAWLTGRQPYGAVLIGLSVLPSKPQ